MRGGWLLGEKFFGFLQSRLGVIYLVDLEVKRRLREDFCYFGLGLPKKWAVNN
jgi:hypothetical protein